MESKNLDLWENVEKTPKDLIVEIDAGDGKKLNSIPSINRFKKATELFGMYGNKWGLKNIEHSELAVNTGLMIGNLKAVFFYTHNDKCVEFEISNSISIISWKDKQAQVNFTYRKALETDTVTKALSKLGFNADIYTDGDLIAGEVKGDEINKDDLVSLGEDLEGKGE